MLKKLIQPIKIFYCYAHEDRLLRDELEKHLANLRRWEKIENWHDREIGAGEEWEREISQQMGAANIIFLLISRDFMASDYCYCVEMKLAIERHKAKLARVIPIILRPTDWQGAPFSKLQVLPPGGKPITEWRGRDRDKAFLTIAQGIRQAVEELIRFQKTKEQWMDEGKAFLSNGLPEEALVTFEYASQLVPNDAYVHYYKGLALHDLGDEKEALGANERALKLDPDNLCMLEQHGHILLTLENYQEALKNYERALKLQPNLVEALCGKGVALAKLEQYEEALATFEHAIQLYPASIFYAKKQVLLIHLHRYEEALKNAEEAIERFPEEAEHYLNKGAVHNMLQQYEEAVSAYEKALQRDPDNAQIRAALASGLGSLKRLEDAERVAREALQHDSQGIVALFALGEALLGLKRFKEALDVYERIIQFDPDDWGRVALVGKFRALVGLDRLVEAGAALECLLDPLGLSLNHLLDSFDSKDQEEGEEAV